MRIARDHVPGIVHHLIWRFVEHRWFLRTAESRATYLRLLGRALEQSDWQCISYALMSNHIHLAAVAGRSPLAEWSRCANLPFAAWVNHKHGRIGPVFADRAWDHGVAPGGIAALIGYIHNNPVRASVVKRAADSSWTSHRAYLAVAPPPWLHTRLGLELARLDLDAFDDFVDSHPDAPERPKTMKILRATQPFGQINAATPFERQVPLVIRPFGRIRPDPRRVVELASAMLGLDPARVASRSRNKQLHLARVAAIHSGVAVGLTGADMAATLGVSQQTVSRIVRYARRPADVCERIHAQLLRELRSSM